MQIYVHIHICIYICIYTRVYIYLNNSYMRACKTSRKYTDPARKQGSWASITFQDKCMPQMAPMTGGSWERASLDSMNIEAVAANWVEARKATLLIGLN